MLAIWFLALVGSSLAQLTTNIEPERAGIVQLFEWHWNTIADECENFLGPMKWGAVQISPPSENRLMPGRPWYERYQPVSYKLTTRSGSKTALQDMITRCNRVGVRVYADVLLNHMLAADAGRGRGTAGSSYDATRESFPGVPYTSEHFNNRETCPSSSGNIEDYQDVKQVRNCRLSGLLDLKQSRQDVRDKLISYMNELVRMGVAGFRIDAAKHMWPKQLKKIIDALDTLPETQGFVRGTKPFIYQQVIDMGNEPITASEYFELGRVTEFKYQNEIIKNKDKIQYLLELGEAWKLMPRKQALVFLDNHDLQRNGGSKIISFENPYLLKIFTAYMMAFPYGVPRVMSSYYFSNPSQGPPAKQRVVKPDGSCGNGWVCEHRWPQIKNMAELAALSKLQPLANQWTSGNNQIAFSRGRKAFLAINKASTTLSKRLRTGLPQGKYCNIFLGEVKNGHCTGPCVTVDAAGYAQINIPPSENPVVALHVNATVPLTGICRPHPPPAVVCTDCSRCTQKIDCGYVGIDQERCEGRGCLWCVSHLPNEPWCVKRTSDAGATCHIADQHKEDCGYVGIEQRECETKGCCYKKLGENSPIPYCYYPK